MSSNQSATNEQGRDIQRNLKVAQSIHPTWFQHTNPMQSQPNTSKQQAIAWIRTAYGAPTPTRIHRIRSVAEEHVKSSSGTITNLAWSAVLSCSGGILPAVASLWPKLVRLTPVCRWKLRGYMDTNCKSSPLVDGIQIILAVQELRPTSSRLYTFAHRIFACSYDSLTSPVNVAHQMHPQFRNFHHLNWQSFWQKRW